jgi:hypothetical protein
MSRMEDDEFARITEDLAVPGILAGRDVLSRLWGGHGGNIPAITAGRGDGSKGLSVAQPSQHRTVLFGSPPPR